MAVPSPSPPKGKGQAPSASQAPASSSASSQAASSNPSATTALGALDQLLALVEQYHRTKSLAGKRKDEITSFVDHARTLFTSELAAARAGSSAPGPGALAPGHVDVGSLHASLAATQQAVASLQSDIAQVVQSAVQRALETAPPAPRAQPCAIPPQPPLPPRDEPHHLDVTIGIPAAVRPEQLATLSALQLKDEVDAALDASGIDGLVSTRIHAVKRLPSGSLLIRASSSEQADRLFCHDGAWLAHLKSLRGAQIERKSYTLVAGSVPTDFDPTAPHAAEAIWRENAGIVASKTTIRGLRWLHAGRAKPSSKREGSLVFRVEDMATADLLICSSLSIRGALCPVSKFVPSPQQCFRCQRFGHLAKACPSALSPSSLKCARCAGPHSLRECECPARPKCTDLRRCTHIHVECANCHGDHKSFDSKCPQKVIAQAAVAARFDNRSRYYNPRFRPPFSHPPPRAGSAASGV